MQDDPLAVPSFTVGTIADAADVSSDTIRTWFKRGDLLLGETDLDAPGEGLARKLSGRTALAIAIMGALTKIGFAPAKAASAAIEFAHSGDDRRNPGHLFPAGETFLVVGLAGAEVVCVDSDAEFYSVFKLRRQNELPLRVFLALDDLVDRTRVKLKLGRDLRAPVTSKATGYAKTKKVLA